jgi:2-dehydro-3-deoxygluconokinase
VLYDRAASALAIADPAAIDWPSVLDRASWLHVSGITSALSANAAAANQRAADAAVAVGATVSFDCNYREQLWASAGVEPRTRLKGMLASARIAFADERDIAMILGGEFAGDATARRRAAAAAAFRELPLLERICTTIRDSDNVSKQRLSGVMLTREHELQSRTHSLDRIVDRVGAGDAFAAGILHGLLAGYDEQRALEFAVAAAALKHSLRGDFNLVDLHDVAAVLANPTADIRR